MSNPNNCSTCDWMKIKTAKETAEGAHCHMFEDEPDSICPKHTLRYFSTDVMLEIARKTGWL